MKIRTFFITLFAPFILYLLASQAALTTWSLNEEHLSKINDLQLAVVLDDTIPSASADELSSKLSEITGNPVRKSSAEEQLEQFTSKFKVDVMSVLSDNPFGIVLFSSIKPEDDPVAMKSTVAQLKGVRTVAYPDAERAKIDASYRDSQIKLVILDVILGFALIFIVWMAERLEGATNEPIMNSSSAPYVIKRQTFHRRAFIKGVLSGLMAAVVFLGLRMAFDVNREVSFSLNFDRCVIIAASTIVVSSLLTYFMQLIAFPIANKNSRKIR